MNRLAVLLILVLGGLYLNQHQSTLQRWWYRYTQPATAPVLVYTTFSCDVCEKTAASLEAAGVQVVLVSIESDEAARAEFEAAGRVLPIIVDGDRRMYGIDPELLAGWYQERHTNRQWLEEIGVYGAGEPHIPVLFGTDWCPYCAKARQYFDRNGIRFHDLDIERDAEAARQYKAIGRSGIPVLVYEDMILGGFDEATMERRREWIGDGQ